VRKKLYVSQIEDKYAQQNFQTIGGIFQTCPFLKGEWFFLPLSIPASGNNLKIPHTLSFTPKDVILLSVIGGTITFNYNLFDKTFLNVNATVTTAPMAVRIFVGRYSEESVNV
jgi:hypothetical protein